MPPPRYTVRPYPWGLRLWQTTLLQWEQAGLYGRILRTSANQHNLCMPQPRRPPLRPTINLLSSPTPPMRPPLGNNPIMGGHTQVSPTPLYGSLQLTRTDLHSPRAPMLNRGGLCWMGHTHLTLPMAPARGTTKTMHVMGGHGPITLDPSNPRAIMSQLLALPAPSPMASTLRPRPVAERLPTTTTAANLAWTRTPP